MNMSLVQGYSSDEDDVATNDAFGISNLPLTRRSRADEAEQKIVADAAPHVLSETSLVTRPTDTQMNVNIPYADMIVPLQGPENPFSDRNRFLNQNALAGHVEEQAMSDHAFKTQHLTHAILGYSANPSIDPNAPAIPAKTGFATIDSFRTTKTQKRELKRKRKDKGDLDIVDGEGAYVGPWASWDDEQQDQTEDTEEPEPSVPRKKAKPKRGAVGQEMSVFHGKSMTDYQGRTYMHPPIAGSSPSETFIPKVCIHTWTGHTQGVSVHLLLSGSMDTKIKLWDIYTHGNCLRTFHGHVQAVKDMKLWDTETGQCLQRFSNGKTPYYDINSGEITQEYDQHLGPVNTITFVDENRRFVTTSDDKTIRAWDFDIPVVIKYIAEPHMHSMPAVTLHPSKKYFAAQSLDNQILVYSTDNFRQNRKKRFAGHSVAGYACQVGFSPDGKWISSGDSTGNVIFWDWKTGRIKSRLQAHSKVVIAHEWLPHESSKVVTASWDGLIKLWCWAFHGHAIPQD
ncbi:pre-mRNA splicing factor [Pisolithus croceorrhizus]|nr:pre-mRNA splicing factor [Pisolithus croceorrhizus]